jgi:hypothetical protein
MAEASSKSINPMKVRVLPRQMTAHVAWRSAAARSPRREEEGEESWSQWTRAPPRHSSDERGEMWQVVEKAHLGKFSQLDQQPSQRPQLHAAGRGAC